MAFTKIAASGIGSTGTVTLENIVVTGDLNASTITGAASTANVRTNSLNVSGVTTSSGGLVVSSGNVLIGTGTSTGTTSQKLQVTGGAYVSGNIGVGTTNPTSKLQVVGDTRVSGVVTAFDFYNDAEYPSVRPTLDLAFAQTKILDSRITFTRASTATYVNASGLIASAAVNEARFDHDPATGESLGLLVEEARTNLVTYSEQFDNAAWAKGDVTVTANAVIAPDGTTTADEIVENLVSNPHRVIKGGLPSVAGSDLTVSVFVKRGVGTRNCFIYLRRYTGTGWGGCVLNFDTESLTIQSGNNHKLTKLPNGWFKVSFTGTADSTGLGEGDLQISLVTNDISTQVYPGDGTSSIYAWGAQLEAGSFPTSYIPTVASTVTRAADVASMTGTNFSSWYRQDEGTVFCQGISNSRSNSSYWTTSNGGSNGAAVLVYPNNNITYQVVNSSIQVNTTFATYSAVSSVKTAAAIKLNNFAVVANGGSITSDTSGTVPAVTSFVIGNYLGGGTSFDYSGTIARLTYYPARLPDAQLQTITL
jgi:hypothetical protein